MSHHALLAVHSRSPDQALVLLTAGLCLIFLELNRPGWILPGAAGLALMLLEVPGLLIGSHPLWASLLLLVALFTCLLHLWVRIPLGISLLATLGLIVAARYLIAESSPQHVHWGAATVYGVVTGGLSTVLARIALRARQAKQVSARNR